LESIGNVHHWDDEVIKVCYKELKQLEKYAEIGKKTIEMFDNGYSMVTFDMKGWNENEVYNIGQMMEVINE